MQALRFFLPDGSEVPEHFHVTEVGIISKSFIDCGGVLRQEKKISFQLWNAADEDHRLKPIKFKNILALAERKLQLSDEEIEVEYQGKSIEKYGLSYENGRFLLQSLTTDCLAKDKCGIPEEKLPAAMVSVDQSSCRPGSGCCS
jgi:hypothetical protein